MTTAGVAAPTVFSRRSSRGGRNAAPCSRRAWPGLRYGCRDRRRGRGRLAAAHELERSSAIFSCSSPASGGRTALHRDVARRALRRRRALHPFRRAQSLEPCRARPAVETTPTRRAEFPEFHRRVEVLREAAARAVRNSRNCRRCSMATTWRTCRSRRSRRILSRSRRGRGRLSRFAIGDEPQRISARDYARLWSGGDLLLPGGYGNSGAEIRRRSSHSEECACRSDRLVGPGRLCRHERRNDPRLLDHRHRLGRRIESWRHPLHARSAGDDTGRARRPQMGALKVGLSFDFSKLMCRPAISSRGRRAAGVQFRLQGPFGRDIVVAVFGGDFARTIARSDEDADQRGARPSCDGSSARTAFRGGKVHAWFRDPNALAAIRICLPGAPMRAKSWPRRSQTGIFAGEATGLTGGAMTPAARRWLGTGGGENRRGGALPALALTAIRTGPCVFSPSSGHADEAAAGRPVAKTRRRQIRDMTNAPQSQPVATGAETAGADASVRSHVSAPVRAFVRASEVGLALVRWRSGLASGLLVSAMSLSRRPRMKSRFGLPHGQRLSPRRNLVQAWRTALAIAGGARWWPAWIVGRANGSPTAWPTPSRPMRCMADGCRSAAVSTSPRRR